MPQRAQADQAPVLDEEYLQAFRISDVATGAIAAGAYELLKLQYASSQSVRYDAESDSLRSTLVCRG